MLLIGYMLAGRCLLERSGLWDRMCYRCWYILRTRYVFPPSFFFRTFSLKIGKSVRPIHVFSYVVRVSQCQLEGACSGRRLVVYFTTAVPF